MYVPPPINRLMFSVFFKMLFCDKQDILYVFEIIHLRVITMVGVKISISGNPTAPKKLVKVTLDFSFTGHCSAT